MTLRATLLVGVLLVCGCEPALTPETLKLVQLPADLQTGPATDAVQTKDGRVYALPIEGGLLRLATDGGAWDVLDAPVLRRFLHDFQSNEALAITDASPDVYREVDGGFVPLIANLPLLTAGNAYLRGRDGAGTLWATTAATGLSAQLSVWRLEPADPTAWKFDLVPLADLGQTIPATNSTLTSDGRLFFRPYNSGVWEVDRANAVMVERVKCDHELFRASHPDYRACQEDTYVYAGRNGELFILNPNHELWRIAPSTTTPVLVVKGELPKLQVKNSDGTNRYAPGGPRVYVDPKGRFWLCFTWGNNDADDTSYLYVVDPAKEDAWTYLIGSLPRNLVLFGNGELPLLSSMDSATGLKLWRLTF